MRKKILMLIAAGISLQMTLLAHPGHGTPELQTSVWHWIVEPLHLGLGLGLAVAGSVAVCLYRRRSA